MSPSYEERVFYTKQQFLLKNIPFYCISMYIKKHLGDNKPLKEMSKNSSSQSANALRILAADAVQKANCGHPGMPMGMAEIAEVLWRRHLIHNPSNPHLV